METFGKLLPYTKDILKGFRLDNVKVFNPEVITLMDNNNIHPVAIATNNPDDEIIGTVFELNDTELVKAETFIKKYTSIKTIEVTLNSGKNSLMYVADE